MSTRRVPGLRGSSIQLSFITFRAAGIRPYEMVLTIQRTLNKERTAVSPLQSALRAASFPQGKLLVGAEAAPIQRTALFRYVAGRQIAAPYGLSSFWRLPFNRQLNPDTRRAAGIRPYGGVPSIQRAGALLLKYQYSPRIWRCVRSILFWVLPARP